MKKFNTKSTVSVILMVAFAAFMPLLNSCSTDADSDWEESEVTTTASKSPAIELSGTPLTAPLTATASEYSEPAVTTGTPRTAPLTVTVELKEKSVKEDEVKVQQKASNTQKYVHEMGKGQLKNRTPHHYVRPDNHHGKDKF